MFRTLFAPRLRLVKPAGRNALKDNPAVVATVVLLIVLAVAMALMQPV